MCVQKCAPCDAFFQKSPIVNQTDRVPKMSLGQFAKYANLFLFREVLPFAPFRVLLLQNSLCADYFVLLKKMFGA